MSLGGGNGGPAYAFPGAGGSEAVSAQPAPPPEEFQPNAGPPVTVPAPQQGPYSIGKNSGFSFVLNNVFRFHFDAVTCLN